MNDIIKCPKCGSQARNYLHGMSTAICWIPYSYDKDGKEIFHPDPNIYTSCWQCTDCGCHYTSADKNGEITIKEGYL